MERGRAAGSGCRGSAAVRCRILALVPGAGPGAQAGQAMLPRCVQWCRTALGTLCVGTGDKVPQEKQSASRCVGPQSAVLAPRSHRGPALCAGV